jgi:prolyl oligopeptidase
VLHGVTIRDDYRWLEDGKSREVRAWAEAENKKTRAIANLRGGGELGEEWHEAGKRVKKQNVFDDFFACAEMLFDKKLAARGQLAAWGRSNGGLLMGAALTQRPELFRAIVSHVGIYDMIHYEDTPNGAFNVTEYGTVKNAADFAAIFAYSPYHRVKDGAAYPATLLLTAANDARVDPYNSRKMAARMQAASPASTLLLRTSFDTGHGAGTPLDAEIEEQTDVLTFLFSQLKS